MRRIRRGLAHQEEEGAEKKVEVEQLCTALTYRRSAAVNKDEKAREWADHVTITEIMDVLGNYVDFKPKHLEDLDPRALEMMKGGECEAGKPKGGWFPRLWEMKKDLGDQGDGWGSAPSSGHSNAEGGGLLRELDEPVRKEGGHRTRGHPGLPGRPWKQEMKSGSGKDKKDGIQDADDKDQGRRRERERRRDNVGMAFGGAPSRGSNLGKQGVKDVEKGEVGVETHEVGDVIMGMGDSEKGEGLLRETKGGAKGAKA